MKTKTIRSRKQSGSSLVVVISVLATLMVIVGVAAEYTYTVNRHVKRSNTLQSAVAVADSCIEVLFANWRNICSAPATTLRTTNDFTSIALPTASQLNLPSVTNFVRPGTGIDPAIDEYDPTYTISNYKVIAVTPEWTALASSGTLPMPMLGPVVLPSPSASPTTSVVYNYIASADVTLPALGPTGTVVAKVRRVFQKQQVSPWNFAIFYVDPLEIHPGPLFTVTGWVHTNSDLYTGHDTLTFADKVTYGSDWFVNFMTPQANPRTWVDNNGVTHYAVAAPGDTTHPETPAAPHYVSNLPPAHDQSLQPFGLDALLLFNTTDVNPNNDSYRELIERPSAAAPDPLANQRYWNQADVIIKVSDISGNPTVTIGKPHYVNGVADGTITALNSIPSTDPNYAKYQALYNMFNTSGAITTTNLTTITDTRESVNPDNTRLVTIDLSKIQNNTSGLNPTFKANDTLANSFNGIVYIYDTTATTHGLLTDGSVDQNPTTPTRRGVRLKNGSKIASTGLTVVSPNPVYVWGDYNTGRDYNGNTNPPSNNAVSDPTQPTVSGYKRASCSILADAVDILSNSWVDIPGQTYPTASNTTVNAAIVSGIVPTNAYGGGNYSGGAENFPRFLENWDTKALTYYGSMVELYKSQQAIGTWACCSPIYSPPIRQWYFDNNFKTSPPPGTLMLYSYIKGKWSVF